MERMARKGDVEVKIAINQTVRHIESEDEDHPDDVEDDDDDDDININDDDEGDDAVYMNRRGNLNPPHGMIPEPKPATSDERSRTRHQSVPPKIGLGSGQQTH